MRRIRFAPALHAVLERSALPYGYTLTVWSSGAVLTHRHGLPTTLEVFLFLAGGAAAFAALVLAGRLAPAEPLDASPPRLKATGALNLLGVAAAVGVATFAARLPGHVAWPVGSFGATVTFLTSASAALASAHVD